VLKMNIRTTISQGLPEELLFVSHVFMEGEFDLPPWTEPVLMRVQHG
jgi:hypothetical protein